MTTAVLVAYATRHGSTAQVAGAVAGYLRSHVDEVTLAPVRDVRRPVDRYALVVLGAPLYSGRWHRDAHRFLKRHRAELARVPVAVFGMGPRTDDEQACRRSRAQLDRALSRHGWLGPAVLAVFGGVDPPDHHGRKPQRDLRDWTAIRSWTLTLPVATAAGTAGAPTRT
jgi:menaquinone-dependent protoporphyrinogen oxidase